MAMHVCIVPALQGVVRVPAGRSTRQDLSGHRVFLGDGSGAAPEHGAPPLLRPDACGQIQHLVRLVLILRGSAVLLLFRHFGCCV